MRVDPDSLPIVGKDNLLLAPYLTKIEKETLRLMARGFTNTSIGPRIFRNDPAHTVKCLFRKLGVGSRPEAVAAGFRYGILYWTDGRLEIVP